MEVVDHENTDVAHTSIVLVVKKRPLATVIHAPHVLALRRL